MVEPTTSNEDKRDATTKLRCGDPDLQVILKYTDEEDNAARKVYLMYKHNLARISDFMDTSLSIEMKEKASRVIVFQDVNPDLFEKALKFQQDFLAVRSMTAQDALDVMPFYHMYEFTGGVDLCDDVLSEHIQENQVTHLLQLFSVVEMAQRYNMARSLGACTTYINEWFLGYEGQEPKHKHGAAVFTADQVIMLVPMFKEGLLSLPAGIDVEDLDSPLFPRYFMKVVVAEQSQKIIHKIWLKLPIYIRNSDDRSESKNILELERNLRASDSISFSTQRKRWGWLSHYDYKDTNGTQGTGRAGTFTVTFEVAKSSLTGNDWAIIATPDNYSFESNVLWRSPYSRNLDFPPVEPWVAVDKYSEGTGTPQIQYGQPSPY